ncbi:hypothetical protein EUTSA_v10004158mg [Eutrema salsugineum]|uniref:F-box domain-containing protein n=1 Tax=Eutrema salsugineum TaxID=72664 RepID=V4K5C3_EUTSA|nr:F-box protein At3g27290 [Eutrema salsugineum]ESQ32745.1 hypothetical protein EUTSA_v10004158mg [Eutrema salsugineum]
MDINCDELVGSYANWGMQKTCDYRNLEWGFGKLGGFEEDDLLNRMSFSGYQMLYETVNWVGNGNSTLFNDFLGFGEITGNNVLTSLPEDPFCMNIRSTLNTISDWFHENQIDLVSGSHDEPIGVDPLLLQQQQICDLKFNGFEGLREVTFPEDPFCMKVKPDRLHENQRDLVLYEPIGVGFESVDWYRNQIMSFHQRIGRSDPDDGGEPPHDAFELVLPYLEMKDILAVEGVCRSLRDFVRKEPFFWTTIDLTDSPLRRRVTDDSLLKLTRRAQGKLQCLNLGGCFSITDNGMMQVLASNPHLTKLSVSGCLGLSTAGMLSILRDLKSSNRLGLESLITGGALYFTKEQFKELNCLLGGDAKAGPKSRRQRLYISCRSDFSLEDDGVTDIEICPWCEKPGLIFDCAAETCELKDHPCPKSSCRACIVCIERCHECGGCLNDCEDKPFCFPFSCVVCYKKRSNQFL